MKLLLKALFKGLVTVSILICGMAFGLAFMAILFALVDMGHWLIIGSILFCICIALFSLEAYWDEKNKLKEAGE